MSILVAPRSKPHRSAAPELQIADVKLKQMTTALERSVEQAPSLIMFEIICGGPRTAPIFYSMLAPDMSA